MTKAELEKLCQEWQERLRLQEWQIEIHSIPLLGDLGTYVMNLEKKQAHIRIRDQAYASGEPSTFSSGFSNPEEAFFMENEEQVLVHELVHLLFRPFDKTEPDSLEEKAMEFACTSLSVALVKLKREGEAL